VDGLEAPNAMRIAGFSFNSAAVVGAFAESETASGEDEVVEAARASGAPRGRA
jgi:hypothetical protein